MPRLSLEQRLQQAQAAWVEAGLERRLHGLRGIDFCTNDYLGLARDERLIEAACEATRKTGVGASAARLVIDMSKLEFMRPMVMLGRRAKSVWRWLHPAQVRQI